MSGKASHRTNVLRLQLPRGWNACFVSPITYTSTHKSYQRHICTHNDTANTASHM